MSGEIEPNPRLEKVRILIVEDDQLIGRPDRGRGRRGCRA